MARECPAGLGPENLTAIGQSGLWFVFLNVTGNANITVVALRKKTGNSQLG